jgi:hypothetical protein
MHDLSYVLYAQNVFTPWVDGKYEKRIYRLTALELLQRIITGKIDEYIKTIIFSYIVCNYCITYANTENDDVQNDNVLKVLNDIEHNIVSDYQKHLFDRLSHVCPVTLINPISIEFANEDITNRIPYSDDIIGSLIFYSCILRHNDKVDKEIAKKVIQKFRKDFLYFPLNDNDYDNMIMSAKGYLGKIRDIYVNMFNLAISQKGGHRKKSKSKSKKDIHNASFY